MKVFAVLLSIQIFVASLLPQMDFAELSKVPSLLKHYQLHQKECNYKGSFFDFLSLHYGEKNNDGHDHSDLPFKNCHHTFDYHFNTLNFSLKPIDFDAQIESENIIPYKSSFFSSYFQKILQPPKIG